MGSFAAGARFAIASLLRRPATATDEHGLKVRVYPYERKYAASLLRRPEDRGPFAVMRRVLTRGDVVFDVGANLGFYSTYASRLVGETGTVYAFEPVADTYRRLAETLALNRCNNVIPVPVAVGDCSGVGTMHLFGSSPVSGLNSLQDSPRRNWHGTLLFPERMVQVPVETLDRLAGMYSVPEIAFCKIDVEGVELQVLRGARELLSGGRIRLLCFEVCDEALGVVPPVELFSALTEHGYRIYRYGVAGLIGPIRPADEERRLLANRPFFDNYFASRSDGLT
jgi:FkbM family methyltransferase